MPGPTVPDATVPDATVSDPTVSDPTASDATSPLVLVRHLRHGEGLEPDPAAAADPPLRLPLQADERTSLRGHRRSACGRDLLLQLPRGAALEPGDRLAPETGGPLVVVVAADEPLMVVRAADPLALLQAAYHLGNRHVAMELHRGELRLGVDIVLEDLLRHRGLTVERMSGPFLPEPGAYEPSGHGHRHVHAHGPHDHGHHGHSHP
ncbi:urease accessory protein UreE [Cyanobium sp. N.Huapi 1H5]|uniref:urease accessory protein UreE n=1 Tax=Cyanobium sp. N.Huapi 1H5 TaxID=2823719 RepID=UPI0020CFB515|nr:urease accessory protein UreE [Cyanobium sp. N.Huapi 1H5]MCP9836236.1 urease accessory protein UreE [Cyanobium sp. N.Huapi 1H5]